MSDTECRLFCWKGGFLQTLASARIYTLVFGITSLLQATVYSYHIAIITTVEKRFQITSQLSGIIVSGVDVGTCISVAYLMFYGNKLHKPRSVGFGIILVASSCVLKLLPHLLYGSGTTDMAQGSTLGEKETSNCELGNTPDDICEVSQEGIYTAIILFAGNILIGIGACFYWTLGLTYIDENTRKSKTPFYLGIIMLIKMFGPALGYMIATYSLSINVEPSRSYDISQNDPSWVGAWWLGFIILFAINVIPVSLACAFPRYIPKAYQRKDNAGEIRDSENCNTPFEDFRLTGLRLMKNKVFLFNTLSSTFFVFGMMGMETFGPKYLELQFLLLPAEASFMIGCIGLLCTGFGILSSGVFITLYKPSSRKVALWNVFTESLDVIGYFIFAFLGCPVENLQGHWELTNEWSLLEDCNKFCSCPPSVKYYPVCSESSNLLFYSPCHAGCGLGSYNKTSQIYENCLCSPTARLLQGPCPGNTGCSIQFYSYIIILCALTFFSATGRAGNTLLQFRSVNDEDKAASLAITEGFMSIFAFIPAPIIFGILIDNTCKVWGESCGEKGNCLLYDSKSMRYLINFTICGLLFLGTLADVVVWINSSEVQIFDPEESKAAKDIQLRTPTESN